nr:receptor-like protein EIX2 [Ipomoea batatas]
MLLLVFLLFISKFEYCYSNNNASCIEVERVALLRFKESLIDTSNRLSSWTGLDCCAWEGVSCGFVTGHVWKLDLHNPVTVTYDEDGWSRGLSNYSNNCLRGEISHSLINLTFLNYLDLSLNNFSEIQIPKFLESFKNLRYLNLSDSGFVGNIPPSLGNLSRLEYLHLGWSPDGNWYYVNNDLKTNNLDWLASLSSLKSLDMSSVFIRGSENFFGTINKLVSLSSLNLASCQLNITNPPSLVNSTSLISLDLSVNAWDAMTLLWLSNLTRLENLNLHYNGNLAYNFNSSLLIPFCKLLNMVSMDLSDSSFRGLIPHCLENLTSLTSLNLASNRFEGSVPNSISRLCRLQTLDLYYNELSGSLTDFLGAPSECLSYSLQMLSLEGNYFTGQLPNQLYKYKNLNRLYLFSNSLSGPIADSLGNLSMLSVLDIGSNKFSGSIPTSLGQLSNLDTLFIDHNSFQGILSESHFSKLTNLEMLSISGNSLFLDVSSNWIPPFQVTRIYMNSIKVGPHFPQWLRTQTKLDILYMSNASISDAIPDWFGNLFWTCSDIDLSENDIRGELPMSVEGSLVWIICLSHNHLTGEIPKWLCNLKHLEILDIPSNKLSGEIPSCFGELQELEYLDLGNNHLFGHIPNSLGSLNNLYSLHLQNNKFEGGLPSSLQNLRRLITLDLSENGLMDVIPSWIGENLASLRFLNFQKNKFFGDIPFQLCYLKALQLLNLANNNISGSIPKCFNNFTAMVNDSSSLDDIIERGFNENIYEDIKGLRLQYTTTLLFLRSIDLSGNHIIGEIPTELMCLLSLNNLNLSANNLSGNIPQAIGNLSKIESLDLSRNALSGLCGTPLLKSCPGDDKLPPFANQPVETKSTDDDHEFMMWFYTGLGPDVLPLHATIFSYLKHPKLALCLDEAFQSFSMTSRRLLEWKKTSPYSHEEHSGEEGNCNSENEKSTSLDGEFDDSQFCSEDQHGNVVDTATTNVVQEFGSSIVQLNEIDYVDSEDELRSISSDSDVEGCNSSLVFSESKFNLEDFKFQEGMVFKDNKEFKWAVERYEALRKKDVYFVMNNEPRRVRAKCRNANCDWVIFGSKSNENCPFSIKTYMPNHSCGEQHDNQLIKSGFLAKYFKDEFKLNEEWGRVQFQKHVKKKFRCNISKFQSFRAKQKAKLLVTGSQHQQYNLLPDYCEELMRTNPGTTLVGKLSRKGEKKKCSICGQYGHNKLSCKNQKQNDVEPTAAIEVEHPVAIETEVEPLVADIATEVEPLVAEVANVEVQPPAAIPWLIPSQTVGKAPRKRKLSQGYAPRKTKQHK